MIMLRVGVLCVVLLLYPAVVLAARTATSDGVIKVTLELGQATAVFFPEEISTITTPMKKTVLDVTKDNFNVGFVPMIGEMPPNRNVVVGVSGRVYLVVVSLAAPGKSGDDIVYVTHKAPTTAKLLDPASVLRLIRDPKGGADPQPLTLPLPTLPDQRVSLSQPRQYGAGVYQVLVVTVHNAQETVLSLDDRVGVPAPPSPAVSRLDEWIWPPGRRLAAVGMDTDVLPPHGSTTVYAVFEER